MGIHILNRKEPTVTMCQRKGCRLIASQRPILHLPGVEGGEAAKLEPKIALCEKHAEAGVEDFLSRARYEVLKMKYARSGRVPPDYKDITIKFVRINPFNV